MKVASVDLPSTVRRCARREASDDTAGPLSKTRSVSSWHHRQKEASNEMLMTVRSTAKARGMQWVGLRARGGGQATFLMTDSATVSIGRQAYCVRSAQAFFGAALFSARPPWPSWLDWCYCVLLRGAQWWHASPVCAMSHTCKRWRDSRGPLSVAKVLCMCVPTWLF